MWSKPVTDKHDDRDASVRARLIDIAKKSGADEADVIAMRGYSVDVSVRGGTIEDASRSEDFGIGLRVFNGRKCAYGSTADASDAGLQRLAEQVCAMASAVPEDPYTRLAARAEAASSIPDLDLVDDMPAPDVKILAALAARAEASALSQKGITKSDSANASNSLHVLGYTTSNGFDGAYFYGSTHVSLSVIAGADDAMETDHASASATHLADLESPEEIGLRAARRTLDRLNPRTGKTGQFSVIFDRRVSSSILRTLARAISGPRIAKGTSFLCGKMGQKICSDAISIIDDPLKKRGHRSGPFDGEGLPVARRTIVDDGVLQSLFLDIRSSARLGMAPTGHATRGLSSPPSPSPSNLWIAAGSKSRADILKEIGTGFLVTDLMGASISLSTGDYSRGASGFWIENGEIAYPVSEMTIAGNLADMFLRMMPASDLEFRDGIDAPSLLIEGMTTASR